MAQLKRDMENKVIGGVCAGLARHMSIDIVVMRLLWVLSTLLWGIGPLIYLIMWLVVPADK